MAQIRQIMAWLDSWAPFQYAESWDNSGLQVGEPGADAKRLLVALDPGAAVVVEAVQSGCRCLVTHHPLLLKPVVSVRTDQWPGNIISRAVLGGLNIIAVHTNLDAARDGTNARMRDLLGLVDARPLHAGRGFAEDERYMGIGLVGTLAQPVELESLAAALSAGTGGAGVRVCGHPAGKVVRAAVCSGSGGSLIPAVLAAGVDVFVTGDVKYHDAKLAEEFGLALIDMGHYASEKLILAPLAEFLESKARDEGVELEIMISKSEKDPFRIITGDC